MSLYFITGNPNKLAEVQAIIPTVEQLDIDLPEIQELDAREVVKAKLLEACRHYSGEFIIEDTSLYLAGLNGLPGPLIKWFLQALGNDGLYKLAKNSDTMAAAARTIIGYARGPEEIYFFEGVVDGRIIQPTGAGGFGWDPIFQPNGQTVSFAEMSAEDKNLISMRRQAVGKLKVFLEKIRGKTEVDKN